MLDIRDNHYTMVTWKLKQLLKPIHRVYLTLPTLTGGNKVSQHEYFFVNWSLYTQLFRVLSPIIVFFGLFRVNSGLQNISTTLRECYNLNISRFDIFSSLKLPSVI